MRAAFITILVPLLVCIYGCGAEEVTVSHRDIASAALLTPDDLPGRVKIEGGLPPEPCGPVGIFRANKGKTAETKMFNFGGIRVQEAVGVFPREGLAELSYNTLVGREHRYCIGNAMASFGRPGDEIDLSSPRQLQAGDRAAQFRLTVTGPNSEERGAVVVPSIRQGRCVSALVVFTKDADRLTAVAREIASRAAQALPPACR